MYFNEPPRRIEMRIHDLLQKTIAMESQELVLIADAVPSIRLQGALEELNGEEAVLDADIRNFVTVALHPMQMTYLEKHRCLDLSWRYQDRYWRSAVLASHLASWV
jgi:Tfp pilus assembly pilus retraction ATPase PilT